MKKKAFIKTVEILIAIILTTIFMLAIMPKQVTNKPIERKSYLIYLEKDNEFRDFVMRNTGCFDSESNQEADNIIRKFLPNNFEFTLCSGTRLSELPAKLVFADTLFFSGNITETNFKVIRLYYWYKE